MNEIFKQLLLSIQDQDGCLLILDFNFMASICKFVGNPLNWRILQSTVAFVCVGNIQVCGLFSENCSTTIKLRLSFIKF